MRIALLIVAMISTSVASQTSFATSALKRLADAESSKTRFTDHKLTRTTNTEPDGTDLYSATELYEETWINDLPYERLLQVDGKPLSGQRAREEQARYDAAVAGRRPLGTDQRIRLNKAQPVGIDADPLRALSGSYTLRELAPEGALHVFVAEPHGSLPDRCSWRYTFWVEDRPEPQTPSRTDQNPPENEAAPFLVRYRADVLNPTSETCAGAWQEVSYILVEGVQKPAHVRAHFFQMEAGDRITIDGDDTYSDYRRFTTHITIGPATVVP